MASKDNIVTIIGIIVATFVLQLALVMGDNKETLQGAVLEFAQAYYNADPAMAQRLCSELADDEETDVVGNYIDGVMADARDRGFKPSFMRNQLYHIEMETLERSDTEAKVHLTANSITAINPVFALVSKIFSLGEVRTVNTVVPVVKEGGKWKVCAVPLT